MNLTTYHGHPARYTGRQYIYEGTVYLELEVLDGPEHGQYPVIPAVNQFEALPSDYVPPPR